MWKLIILVHGVSSYSGYGGPVALDQYETLDACRLVAERVVNSNSADPGSWLASHEASVSAAFCINSKTGETVGIE